jgi:hypothetical protein
MKRTNLLSATLVALCLTALISGCASFDDMMRTSSGAKNNSGSQATVQSIPGFTNNSTINLDAVSYRSVVIDMNKVNIIGKGPGATILVGDLRITGNVVSLKNLSVNGNVFLEGNNVELTDVEISGRVESTGNNNSW